MASQFRTNIDRGLVIFHTRCHDCEVKISQIADLINDPLNTYGSDLHKNDNFQFQKFSGDHRPSY